MTAPTFIGVTAVPTDGASAVNAGPTVTLDKDAGALASAQAGDLIVIVCQYRGVGDAVNVTQMLPNEYGGQCWNIERGFTGNNHHSRMFWCRFNGTWTADPTVSHYDSGFGVSGTAALTAVAMVFRPDNAADHWVVCNGPIRGTFTAGTTPFTKTITGLTPRKNDTVTIAVWSTADDNTWGSLSGTNWTQSGLSAQYRNTTGTDQSLAIAYQLQGTAAATNNVSLNQATLGGDAGGTQLISFAAITMPEGTNVATVADVQTDDGGYSSSSSTTVTATLASGVTSGNSVVGAVHFETAAGSEIVSILDDQSNEYYQLVRVNDMPFEQTKLLFWRPGITNAPTTVTLTLSTAEIAHRMCISEVAGLGVFDLAVGKVQHCDDNTSIFNPATPSLTPSVNGCYLLGSAQFTGGGNFDAVQDADGWTLIFGGINGTPEESDAYHRQIQTTATAEDYDIDVPANVNATVANLVWAAFRPAVAAGSGLPPLRGPALQAVNRAATY